jgi:dihydroorotase
VLHLGVMPVGAYEMIRHAKFDLGQQVTAELECTSMFMTRAQMEKVGPFVYSWAHSPADAWNSVKSGVTDILVLEHAPHTREDVEPGWTDTFSVPLGMTGAQEFVPLVLDAVNKGQLTLSDVVRYTAGQPARTFGVFPRKGVIQVGADADFTIIDMKRETLFRAQDMLTKSGHTSWEGMTAKGAPVYTLVRGSIVMRDGRVEGAAGYGRFVPGVAASSNKYI